MMIASTTDIAPIPGAPIPVPAMMIVPAPVNAMETDGVLNPPCAKEPTIVMKAASVNATSAEMHAPSEPVPMGVCAMKQRDSAKSLPNVTMMTSVSATEFV